MNIDIRPAVEADVAVIGSMVREARLVPTNLRWSRFLVAEAGGLIVGIQQIKIHKGGTREVASWAVRPDFRGLGIGAELMRASLARESEPLYLRCNEKWARHYEWFGFRRVEPSELPKDFRRDYRIGTTIVAIRFLFARHKPRLIPMQREGCRTRPARDDQATRRQRVRVRPLRPKTGTAPSRKDGDRRALDE